MSEGLGSAGGGGISTILFDLDNTLLLTREADWATCIQVATWLEDHRLSTKESQEITWDFLQKFREAPAPSYSTDMAGLDMWRRNIWAAVLPSDNLHLLDDVYDVWKYERLSQLSLDSTVTDMLDYLADHFNLGIITNGSSVAQWEKIKETGCQKYFTSIVVSGDLGVEKPNKDIYHVACQELQVPVCECIMVGDKLETDIQGGVNAGVGATVWVNSIPKDTAKGALQPDFTIPCVTHLTLILPLLARH